MTKDAPVWKYKRIIAHEGPLHPSHRKYMGSKYNILIEWVTGEVTAELLSTIATNDSVTCALYTKEHGLLELDGWKHFKGIAWRHKKLLRMVNQAKLQLFCMAPKYMYGYEVPRDYDHAV